MTYTPAANYYGPDSFTFKANDGTARFGTCDGLDHGDAGQRRAGGQRPKQCHHRGRHRQGHHPDRHRRGRQRAHLHDRHPPAHGTLSGTAPNLTYTPAANYNGADSFTFKVNDGTVDSAPATVSITVTPVNDAPVATPQSVSTAQNTAKAITLAGTDVDGSALTYTVVTQPDARHPERHRAESDLHAHQRHQRA